MNAIFRLVSLILVLRNRLFGGPRSDPSDSWAVGYDLSTIDDPYGFFVVRDDVRLFYRFWLPVNVPLRQIVCCVHGAGAHGRHFRVLGQRLPSSGVAVFALDLRGHGLSGGRRGDFSDTTSLVQDLVDFRMSIAAAYPGVPIFFWGESAGAPLVVQLASHYSEGLSGIILSCPEIESAIKPSIRDYLKYLPYVVVNPQAKVLDLTDRLHLCNRDGTDVERERTDPLRNNKLDLCSIVEMYRLALDLPRLAGRLSLPTLVLQGGTDLISNPQAVESFYDLIVGADKRLVVFPDAYHGLLHDPDTPQVLSAAEQWLTERQGKA